MAALQLIAKKLMKMRFARQALREDADLSIFKQKPSGRVLFGLFCIAVSYIFCWPLISGLGVFAVYIGKPWIVVAATPVIWTAAHFLCMFGVYLAGMDHSIALFKWLVKQFLQRHLPHQPGAGSGNAE